MRAFQTITRALLLAALVGAGGCRQVEHGMFTISRVKSPLAFRFNSLNKPLTTNEMREAGLALDTLRLAPPDEADASHDFHDDYCDLLSQKKVVMVCLSGGGSRAARLAAHTLARLEEQYNLDHPDGPALVDRIDAWSSVSGGSIYASYVADFFYRRAHHLPAPPARRLFQFLRDDFEVRLITRQAGGMASLFYFWPGNLGYAPVLQALTEWDSLNLFARSQAMFQEGKIPFAPAASLRKLGDLPRRPRFFFNAACLETAGPFLFTQRMIHRDLSGDPLTRLAEDPLECWARGQREPLAALAEPFSYAVTLEDLGGSHRRFPVVHAVYASAAFPGAFQPLALNKYVDARLAAAPAPTRRPTLQPKAGRQSFIGLKKQGSISVVDGGAYDNSGLVTALHLAAYLQAARSNDCWRGCDAPRRSSPPDQRFVILAVDAHVEQPGYRGPSHNTFRPDAPVRGLVPALFTAFKIHAKQQALVSAITSQWSRRWSEAGLLQTVEVRLAEALKQAKKTSPTAPAECRSSQPEPRPKLDTDFVYSRTQDDCLRELSALALDIHPDGESDNRAQAFLKALED
jgi:hypothetical protein